MMTKPVPSPMVAAGEASLTAPLHGRRARLPMVGTVGLAVAVGGTILFALASFGAVDLTPELRDVWLYSVVFLGAGVALAARAVHQPAQRTAFALFALAVAASAVGNLYYSLVLVNLDVVPYPSWGDVAYLLFYPLVYSGLTILLRQGVHRWHASLWLDGLIVALTTAALATAFMVAPLLEVTDAELSVAVTNLSYPLADVLLVATVVSSVWILGRRAGRTWLVLATAFIVNGAGDVVFLLQDSAGEYVEGTPIDVTWPLAVTLMALAAVLPQAGDHPANVTADATPSQPRWALIAVPMIATTASLGVLLPWGDWVCPPLAKWLTAGVFIAAIIRSGLTYREVSELAAARRVAATDELTGVTNRRGFTAVAEAHLADLIPTVDQAGLDARTHPGQTGRASSQEQRSLSLLVLDLDDFKEVNDSLGHQAGDTLLIGVAQRLTAACRATDLVARLGGDEFALLLPDTDRARAERVAQRVREDLADPFLLEGVGVATSASIGIAMAPAHGHSLAALMRHADIAMYHAKENRLGAVVYDVEEHGNPVDDQAERREELRIAIDEGQMIVHYQPKVHLASDRVTGVEALARWAHPTRGVLAPGEFLPCVEQLGLMPALTLCVMNQAFAQTAEWRGQGLDLTLSVNLTAAEVVDTSLPPRIEGLLAKHDLPPSSLLLEITEETLLQDRALGAGRPVPAADDGHPDLHRRLRQRLLFAGLPSGIERG